MTSFFYPKGERKQWNYECFHFKVSPVWSVWNLLIWNSAEYCKWNIFSRDKNKSFFSHVPWAFTSTKELHLLNTYKNVNKKIAIWQSAFLPPPSAYMQLKHYPFSLFNDLNQSWKGGRTFSRKKLTCKGDCLSMINYYL